MWALRRMQVKAAATISSIRWARLASMLHIALSSTESGPAANGFLKFDELGLIGIELERDLNLRCGFVLMAEGEFGAGQQVMRLGITGRDPDGGAEKFRGQVPILFLEREHSEIVQRAFMAGIGFERVVVKQLCLGKFSLRPAEISQGEIGLGVLGDKLMC